jgi:hypothetical protein
VGEVRGARRREGDARHLGQRAGPLQPVKPEQPLRKVRDPHRRAAVVAQVGDERHAAAPAAGAPPRELLGHRAADGVQPQREAREVRAAVLRRPQRRRREQQPLAPLEADVLVERGLPRVVELEGGREARPLA